MTEQFCFSFDGGEPQSISGVDLWRERRRVQIDEFGRRDRLADRPRPPPHTRQRPCGGKPQVNFDSFGLLGVNVIGETS